MLTKLVIMVCAVFGAFALMAAFLPSAFKPVSQGWVVPGTSYSPLIAHLIMLGVFGLVTRVKAK